jgi:hypothetical protein
MKTTPLALRHQAGLIDRRDDPDTVTALRWAADDIEELQARIAELEHQNAQMFNTICVERNEANRQSEAANARIAEVEENLARVMIEYTDMVYTLADRDRQKAALSERLTCFEHMAGEDLQRADEDARQIATLREALELFVKRFMEQPLAEIRHPRDDYRNARAALQQDKP